MKKRYLVFLKAEFLRDAQGFIDGAVPCGWTESIFDEQYEDSWRDVNGPVLLMDKTCADMAELQTAIKDNYPNIDFKVLDIMPIMA